MQTESFVERGDLLSCPLRNRTVGGVGLETPGYPIGLVSGRLARRLHSRIAC